MDTSSSESLLPHHRRVIKKSHFSALRPGGWRWPGGSYLGYLWSSRIVDPNEFYPLLAHGTRRRVPDGAKPASEHISHVCTKQKFESLGDDEMSN